MDGIVFDAWQDHLGELDGVTVGCAVLALDNVDTDMVGSMQFLSELTVSWEPLGAPRGTTELAVALEGSSAVGRYATDPPDLDMTGIDGTNAVVFFDTSGVGDGAHEVIFALTNEPGTGFDGWTPDEPDKGLFRVRRVDDDLIAAVLAGITGIDGGTES